MSLYIDALESKHRVRNFFIWFTISSAFYTPVGIGIGGWWSIILVPIASVITLKEKALAALASDAEAEYELELDLKRKSRNR